MIVIFFRSVAVTAEGRGGRHAGVFVRPGAHLGSAAAPRRNADACPHACVFACIARICFYRRAIRMRKRGSRLRADRRGV